MVAVLQELIRRKCIDKVLTGRKETEVCSLLRFIGRNFADMNWQPVLIEVLGILIENYQDRIRNMIFQVNTSVQLRIIPKVPFEIIKK